VGDLAIRSYLRTDGVDGMSSLTRWIAVHWDGIVWASVLLGFAYLAGFVWWRKHTREMLDSVGGRSAHATDHWTVAAFYIGLAMSFTIRFANRPTSYENNDAPTWLAWDALQTGVRLIALAFLLVAV